MENSIEEAIAEYPNLYLEGQSLKGEINVCAVYDGENLIHNPKELDRKKYESSFIKDRYEIEIQLNKFDATNHLPKVFETGGKIERKLDNHFYKDGSCCLGIFGNRKPNNLLSFIRDYILPYFVWQAYYKKYAKKPPWGEYSHDKRGLQEFAREKKKEGRNSLCYCGSGKKFKYCCLKQINEILQK